MRISLRSVRAHGRRRKALRPLFYWGRFHSPNPLWMLIFIDEKEPCSNKKLVPSSIKIERYFSPADFFFFIRNFQLKKEKVLSWAGA
jgi:hypothetical protein